MRKLVFRERNKTSNFHEGKGTFAQNKAANHDHLGPMLCLLSGTVQHYLKNYLQRHRLFVYVPSVKGIKFELGFFFGKLRSS
jgi:hypothetical protein